MYTQPTYWVRWSNRATACKTVAQARATAELKMARSVDTFDSEGRLVMTVTLDLMGKDIDSELDKIQPL